MNQSKNPLVKNHQRVDLKSIGIDDTVRAISQVQAPAIGCNRWAVADRDFSTESAPAKTPLNSEKTAGRLYFKTVGSHDEHLSIGGNADIIWGR